MTRKKSYNILMSATRMNMFLSCKWKYWCNYVLKLPRKPNVSFKLGIAAHESLAVAGKIWREEENFTVESIAKIKDMYNKVAAKEGIADTNTYNDGLQMVLRRVKDFANGKILTIEDKFYITTDEGVMLTGAMDKVEELNEDTLLVTDYKTSKYYETTDELRSDIQLSIYDAVARMKYPVYKRIILSLDYLRGDPVYTYRTDEERSNFMNYMLAIYEEMLKLKQEKAVPILNDMCNWCDFTDNCVAYQEVLSGKSFIKKMPEEYNDEDLVKDYLDIKSRKRIVDNREKQLKGYILNKINSEGRDIVGKGKRIYIRQNANTLYDPTTVFNSVPIEVFLDVVSISKKELDNYLIKNPINKHKIMETAKRSYTMPFLSYKNEE